MGLGTWTYLEALTEATGVMVVAAMQDMFVGFGVWDVLAGARVRVQEHRNGSNQGGHVGQSALCAPIGSSPLTIFGN